MNGMAVSRNPLIQLSNSISLWTPGLFSAFLSFLYLIHLLFIDRLFNHLLLIYHPVVNSLLFYLHLLFYHRLGLESADQKSKGMELKTYGHEIINRFQAYPYIYCLIFISLSFTLLFRIYSSFHNLSLKREQRIDRKI